MVELELKTSSRLWDEIQPTYKAILGLPFIQQLISGELPENIFAYYMQQDALYLSQFARALACTASKAPDTMTFARLLQLANTVVECEMELHQKYINHDDPCSTGKACFDYTNFLLSTCRENTFAEGVASLLPCYAVYYKTAQYIKKHAAPNNRYQEWIDSYASDTFGAEVALITAIFDAQDISEDDYEIISALFQHAVNLELEFWTEPMRRG